MTQELLRDDSLPYREYVQRPGEILDYAFEWSEFLALRWTPGGNFAANAAIRPVNQTGFQYKATTGGYSSKSEPKWPTRLGDTVLDGSIVWTAVAIDATSLQSAISVSAWTADAGVTVPTTSLTGTNATGFVSVATNTADGDYYVRNTITLANSLQKIGLLLIRVRAGKL